MDPFHDFEHPIEGAPDHCVSKSYTRKFTQTATVDATSAGDNLAIFFWGCHGASDTSFYYWGVDYAPDALTTGVAVAPIHVLRTASTLAPRLANFVTGTSTTLARFYTRQVSGIPSRLVSLGVEVTDVTPSLYRKGVIHVAHANGEREEGVYQVADSAGATTAVHHFRKPCTPWHPGQCAVIPGSYVGPAARGVYVQARLSEIQPPYAGTSVMPNGTTMGNFTMHPLLCRIS